MKFSLVLATINRTDELDRFFMHLSRQTYRDFEVIVVDQNPDDRLTGILDKYKNQFSIIHTTSESGLSRARNVGLHYVSGDIIAFPDDDCWYPDDLLETVIGIFAGNERIDGVTGKTIDEHGNDSVNKFSNENGYLTRENLWKRATAATIFLKSGVVQTVGLFDEALGAGSKTIYGAGEEIDYLLAALSHGFGIYYSPDVTVYHHNPILNYDEKSRLRAYLYGCGAGHVAKKHHYGFWFKLNMLIRPLGGTVLSLIRLKTKKAYYHMAIFRGRARGMLK